MKMIHLVRAVCFIAVPSFLLVASPAKAALKPALVFGSHMVLQRAVAVPVWGTANAGEKIVVGFAGQRKETVADAKGEWQVKLDPLAVSAEPKTLTITAGTEAKPETVMFEDVLVGEVWVGSGQSNMAQGSSGYVAHDPVLATNVNATYPLLRMAGHAGVAGNWKVSTTNVNSGFSALLFSFGLRLQQELGVPVGLLCGAVGGTPSGYWLSEAAYKADAACQAEVEKAKASFNTAACDAQFATQMSTWSQNVAQAKTDGKPEPKPPRPALKPGESQAPIGNLYEAHIRAFQPFAIRGVLWDQGEARTGIGNVTQERLMNALVRGWQKEWGQADLPFLVVQKPSGGGCAWDPADPVTRCGGSVAVLPATPPKSAPFREEYVRVGRISGVSLVPTSDLGSGTHPACKSGYGARAARVALGTVYGRHTETAGPTYKSHMVEGNTVRIQFDHVGAGLIAATNGVVTQLQGFAVAGTNGVFTWAKATLDGGSVVLDFKAGDPPVAIRYACAEEIPWANLFNRDGLPAPTFRTDR